MEIGSVCLAIREIACCSCGTNSIVAPAGATTATKFTCRICVGIAWRQKLLLAEKERIAECPIDASRLRTRLLVEENEQAALTP